MKQLLYDGVPMSLGCTILIHYLMLDSQSRYITHVTLSPVLDSQSRFNSESTLASSPLAAGHYDGDGGQRHQNEMKLLNGK